MLFLIFRSLFYVLLLSENRILEIDLFEILVNFWKNFLLLKLSEAFLASFIMKHVIKIFIINIVLNSCLRKKPLAFELFILSFEDR